MSSPLDYGAFDADNHYYEALDAFTRHLDPKHGPRCVQWAEIDGRKYHVVGGRLSRAVKNATFDPIAKPGALCDFFRGNPHGKNLLDGLREREPIPEAYRRAEARLPVMDQQGLEAAWLFPTLGVLYEELLKHDPEAVTLTFSAFNRWIDDDWGFATEERIFAAPYLSLCDLDWALRELDWALERGARVVVMRPAAVWTATGPCSPTDPRFDAFWARLDEAGLPLVIHAGDSGYTSQGYAQDGFSASFEGGGYRPSIKTWAIERAAMDFLATVIFDRLFERFPRLRMPGYYEEDPVETFRRHVWINPFWEDDLHEVVRIMGADRVIFGSDWPHIEGMPQPLDFLSEVEGFDAETRRRILRDNARELNGPPVT